MMKPAPRPLRSGLSPGTQLESGVPLALQVLVWRVEHAQLPVCVGQCLSLGDSSV